MNPAKNLAETLAQALACQSNDEAVAIIGKLDTPDARLVTAVLREAPSTPSATASAMLGALALRRIELSRPLPWLACLALLAVVSSVVLWLAAFPVRFVVAALVVASLAFVTHVAASRRAEVTLLRLEALCRRILVEVER